MFTKNVGLFDRVVRVIVGLALIAGFFLLPEAAPWHWAFWIGLVPLVSGLIGFCPIYRLLGWSTNRDDHGAKA